MFRFLICAALLSFQAFPQQSGPQYRRSSVISSAKFHTIFSNYAVIAQPRPVPSAPKFSWPRISNPYIYDFSFLLGLELPIRDYNNNGTPDTVHSVIITAVERPGGGEYGPNGIFWGFEPLDGYFNPAISDYTKGVALSFDPSTWPAFWPDHPEWGNNVWYGINGPNNFTADAEAVFAMDDKNDGEVHFKWGFLPDSTQPLVKGHGIKNTVHYLFFNDGIFSDVVFCVYKIKNTGKSDYAKVTAGQLLGSYIGGDGDEWNDDVTIYFPKDDYVYAYDFDNHIRPAANPRWKGKTGGLGMKFLDAPSSNKIASCRVFVPAGNITMGNDEEMWHYMRPGNYLFPPSVIMPPDSIPYALKGEDGEAMWATDYFSLASGEEKKVTTAIAGGYFRDETMILLKKAEAFANSGYNLDSAQNKIRLTSLTGYTTINANFNLTWNSSVTPGLIDIWITKDFGKTWNIIARNALDNGTFTLVPSLIGNAPLARIAVFKKDAQGKMIGFNESALFRINCSAAPFNAVRIIGEPGVDTTITSGAFAFKMRIGTMNAAGTTLKASYKNSFTPAFVPFYEGAVFSDTAVQTLMLSLRDIPNDGKTIIKCVVGEGAAADSHETEPFNNMTERISLPAVNHYFKSGNTDATVSIHITNPSLLAGHTYTVTFDDTSSPTQKYFSVFNNSLNRQVLTNSPLNMTGESDHFDGLSLNVSDFFTGPDYARSGWNNPGSNNPSFMMTRIDIPQLNVSGYNLPADYRLEFSSQYNLSSYNLSALGIPLPVINNINFRVMDITDNNLPVPVPFAFVENSQTVTGKLSPNDILFLADKSENFLTYRILFSGDSTAHIPAEQDTLYICTAKGLSVFDSLVILASTSVEVEKDDPEFLVSQNYPNPFSGHTTLKLQIKRGRTLSLKIYNSLGQLIESRVLESGKGNNTEIKISGKGLSSGIYFYELSDGAHTIVNKFIVLH